MIKSLRQKFIGITMLSVAVVLALIIGFINIANYRDVNQTADAKLMMLTMGGGTFDAPEKPSNGSNHSGGFLGFGGRETMNEETPFDTRYFTVSIAEDGNITEVNTDHIAAISATEAKSYALSLYEAGKKEGYMDDYKYSVASMTDEAGTSVTMYIFLDCTKELASFRSFLTISIGVSILGIIAVFILVLFLSKLVTRPIAESYAKQKRFITDASHEIKTPLAIIDANTEVIELENGSSEWTISTKRQIRRLSSLTEKLVFLSRMDEDGANLTMADFNLSHAIQETIESFDSVVEAKHKTLNATITDDITFYGDEGNIRQMMSLLIDNAIKYSDESGLIQITLQSTNHAKQITVWNSVESIEKGDLSVLFERFYRNDSSRNSKTGGHGIGLSVVEAIVHAHKGKITCKSEDGKSILFTIQL